MQVSVEKLEGLERKITVQVPAEDLEQSFQERLQKTAKTIRINGFRPGKVPVSVVKKRYGTAIRQEAIGDIIQAKLTEALIQEKVNPAGMPEVNSITDEQDKPFEFSAIYEEVPEVTLADFSAINIEKVTSSVTDEDVDTMITTLRTQRATNKVVERAAQNGDVVEIDYEGLKDGEAFAGGAAKNQSLELGSNRMIPGFEDGVVGLSAEDEKTLELTFPEDYHNEELKGQAVTFNIKVHKVQEKELPELNKEFIQSMGVESGEVDDFKVEIRRNMERELDLRTIQQTKENTIKALVEANAVDVPKAIVKQEIKRLKQDMMRQFSGQLGTQGKMDESLLPDDIFQERAENSAKAGLILSQIITDNKIKVGADAVKAYIEKQASAYDSPEEVVNHYYENNNLLQQVQSLVLENQVIEHVLDKAVVTEKVLDYQQVMNAQQL